MQGRAETRSAIVNKHTVLTSTVSTLDSDTVTDRCPAVGASGLTTAIGRPPHPPAGPPTPEWSRQGETERRTISLDWPFPVRDSTRDTMPVLVPRDRYTAHSDNTRRSTATTSSGPRLHLPPPPSRVTDPDTERAQQALSWSPHQYLGEDEDDDELNPGPVANPFVAVPGLEDCPLAGLRSALSKPSGATNPTSRQTALWTQSRGGSELKIVRTNRIDPIYSGPDGTEGTTFKALDIAINSDTVAR